MEQPIQYQLVNPAPELADYVYCFSCLQNIAVDKDAIVIPNGKVDLIFTPAANEEHLQIALIGLETKPKPINQQVHRFFSVSFNPLAVEYILQQPIADIRNTGRLLPEGFWGFHLADLDDFNAFCQKMTAHILSLLPKEVDERKRSLFAILADTDGEIGVKELAQKVFWSERQINRYFNQQLGLSLKAYCSILRFQASLPDIKKGQLYPQLNFTDQSHFIKEVKKLSGVSPKTLHRNENDRFLQFLVYQQQ